MTPDIKASRQPLVMSWLAQMVGTIVLAAAVMIFVKTIGARFASESEDWKRYAMMGILAGAVPALAYLRTFKRRLDADEAAFRRLGSPDPGARAILAKSLVIGGALAELPMAMGVVQLFFGGDTRWFLGATMVTIALRLSYRPFER